MNERGEDIAMIAGSRKRLPDPAKARCTNAGSIEAFEALLQRSRQNPDAFWSDAASALDWMTPWHTTRKGGLPHFEYFCGGIANPCVNMIDRHLGRGADNTLALIWEGENGDSRFFTYRMLYHEVNRFANVLKGMGLKKGDAVAVFLPNLAETVIAVLACYRLGVIFNTIFSGFSARALRDRLEHFEPSVIVTADGANRRGKIVPLKEKVDEAIQGLTCVRGVVVIKRTGLAVAMRQGHDHWWDDLMRTASGECAPEPLEANDPSLVFYTSGTTGKPKGVIHSGMGFIVTNYVYGKHHFNHQPGDVHWCAADIGWLSMHIWGIADPLTNGLTTIFHEGALDWPEPDRFYRIVDTYRVRTVFTAPTLIRMLMRHGAPLRDAYDLSSIDTLAAGGEPLNPEAWQWADETLGRGRIYLTNLWGQTELGGTPLGGASWLTPQKPGSCGVPFLGVDMDVVDDQGRSAPANTSGNLIMRTPFPMMCRGLWKEPERFVNEYFSQIPGCYFTYDTAIKDSDDHFWVLGRLDDVINVAGHRLSTMEIESAIMECEGVAEAAVIGVADGIRGLAPVAFVTVRAGYARNDDLRARVCLQVESSIGKLATPSAVYFTDAMPKTASGKIMRRLLREIVSTGTVQGDTTGLEDAAVVARIRAIVHGHRV